MKKDLKRRAFIQQGAMLGGAAMLAGPGKSLAMTNSAANETLKTLHNLRTIHGNFTDQDIPEDQINEIIETSVRAANASAIQSYSIIEIRDKDKMQQVCGYRGACMLVYCVDFNRLIDCAEHLGHPYIPEGSTSFLTATVSTTLAVQTAVIAAKSLGIDSLVTNGLHRGNMERQWQLLDLPEKYCFPLISVVMGYADHEPPYLKGRLSGPGVVHHESYQKLTPEQTTDLIAQYDDPNSHLGLNDGWRNDHKHYLDWLLTKWRPGLTKPMQKASQLFGIMKRTGFVDMQRS